MARKESITVNDILNAAFLMAQEEGMVNVTARKLAAKAGCSTQPIFRVYKNMEELSEALFDVAVAFFDQFYVDFPKGEDEPFVDLGMAYIEFAEKEKNLFQLLFLSEKRTSKSMYDLLNGSSGAVGQEINKARNLGCENPSGLFMKMWIFIHGAACMTITGDYDLNKEETIALLKDSYRAFTNEL